MKPHLLKVLHSKESNMSRRKKGYWTYERCRDEALKYNSRSEFQKNEHGAYVAALKGGFYETIIAHMKPQANGYVRYMYAIEFNEVNSVYVGITNNINRRKRQHYKNSSNKLVRDYLIKYNHKWVTFEDEINKNNASYYEDFKINEYRLKGWHTLNLAKAGALGGTRKFWTKRRCKNIALKFNNKKDFYTKHKSAYQASVTGGWLNEICAHMSSIKRPNGYWNDFNRCINEAKKYNSLKVFRIKAPSAYKNASKNGWLDKCFQKKSKSFGYWSKEECLKQALKYKTRTDFQKKSQSAYAAAQRNGWLDDMYRHMPMIYKKDGFWDIHNCSREALKYTSRTEFSIKAAGAYNASKKNGWLNLVCSHLPKKKPCILK